MLPSFLLLDHNHSSNANDLESIAMPALPGYYTTKEAAEKLGYNSTSSLRYLCIDEKIAGVVKVGKTWFIPESWILEQERIGPKGTGNRGVERK